MSAFALAIASLITGLSVLGGIVVYVLTAANRVEQRKPNYAGDGEPLSQKDTQDSSANHE